MTSVVSIAGNRVCKYHWTGCNSAAVHVWLGECVCMSVILSLVVMIKTSFCKITFKLQTKVLNVEIRKPIDFCQGCQRSRSTGLNWEGIPALLIENLLYFTK